MKIKTTISIFLLMISAIAFAQTSTDLFEKGRKAQAKEDWYTAIEFYQEALKKNASYNLVYQGMAECFYALGEYEETLKNIKKAQKFMPNNAELQNIEGFALIGLGKVGDAKKVFAEVLKTYPNDLDSRFGMAEIDVVAGRLTGASMLYKAALERQTENRKALLSLALISYETGNKQAAETYILQALRYHGDYPQVHFFAAYLTALDGKYSEAQVRLETALKIQPHYKEASELLASILYAQGKYQKVIDICDQLIAYDRNQAHAWYVKTLSLLKLGKNSEALQTAKLGLSVEPDNEIMRILLEEIAIINLEFEDMYRKELADFHVEKGKGFAHRNMSSQALYEYRRALKVYPYDFTARESYAKLLLRFGFPARHLEQLKFIQSINKSNARINDSVEAYEKKQAYSIQNRWKIDPLYLDKAHVSIAIFYHTDPTNVFHPEAERFTAMQVKDSFSYNRRFNIVADTEKSYSYTEAFRKARLAGNDYFGIISIKENDRDICLTLDLYIASTGSKASSFKVYRSGNDRFANSLRRLTQMLTEKLPIVGSLVNRYQSESVIDLGTGDIEDLNEASFLVLKKDSVTVQKEGLGLLYREQDVLGTFTVTKTSEDLSEGLLKRKGYYDRMNAGDIVIREPIKEKEAKVETDTVSPGQQMNLLLALLRSIR
ncbi:tetratricopeptide repeat protein [Treponema phagedenis]|nr:tetratricopeptide repeat protein [Treponema phagedenis]NVP24260.1 tetratricopeptide repeat protein [Treponema phagedenis]QKS91573.1 tetratricopeptide repeat protein [Treponema phagedenis]QLC59770.1 tetratricopeptide repeat protein [Treponema phagedenis]